MATTYNVSCDCGFNTGHRTAAYAARALRIHSCAKWEAKTAASARGAVRRAAVDHTPKACHHKQVTHEHGTYACYTLDRCRCTPCTQAQSTYESDRVRQKAYGRWDNLVDAQPARDHVRNLMGAGMGLKRIVATGAISQGSLWKLLYGKRKPDGTRIPSQRITKAVAARVLAVQLDLADGAYVDSTDTTRRLQALVATGWSMSKLGARLGVDAGNFNPTINGTRTQVTVATAKAVHALYVDLVDQAPPESEWRDKISCTRARNLAAERGWTPPLKVAGRFYIGPTLPLPIDPDLDDLADDPGFDEAAVTRRMNGDRTAPIGKADRVEIVARARAAGWSFLDIEHRTGVNNPDRYLQRDTTGGAA